MSISTLELFSIEPQIDRSYMPIISLWQPWAYWVAWGWKTIETRTHDKFRNLAGKWIGIHAAKKWDKAALRTSSAYLSQDQIKKTLSCEYEPANGLIAVAHVKQHTRCIPQDANRALIECRSYRFGLLFDEIQALHRPIPMRGCQGIWSVPIAEIQSRELDFLSK